MPATGGKTIAGKIHGLFRKAPDMPAPSEESTKNTKAMTAILLIAFGLIAVIEIKTAFDKWNLNRKTGAPSVKVRLLD